jgi:hypothetical protein
MEVRFFCRKVAGSLPDDFRVAQSLKEKENADNGCSTVEHGRKCNEVAG